MNWVANNLDLIASSTAAHLAQSLPPILLAFVLSLPLAKLANARGWLRAGVTTGSGLMYAIPSLPLFVLLPGLLGTGFRSPLNIVIALTLYGLALMVPAASDAFRSVDRDVLSSATAQGYAPSARFWAVELPLAGPVLLAGVRVVAVSTVSLVTVGGVLGVPSLGMLFIDGFRRGIQAEILTGVILTAVLALLLDALLVLLGRALMPWTRRGRPGRAVPGRAGPDQAGPDQAGSDQAGSDQAGPDSTSPARTRSPQPSRSSRPEVSA